MATYDQKALPAYSPGMQHQGGMYATTMQPMQPQMAQFSPQPQFMQTGPPMMMQQPTGFAPQAQPGVMYHPGIMPTNFANECANGHSYKTEYGICGIITAFVCFPCGLFALMVDKSEVCRRCSHTR